MLDMTEPSSATESVSKIVKGLTDSTNLRPFVSLVYSSFFASCLYLLVRFYLRSREVTLSSIKAWAAPRILKPFSSVSIQCSSLYLSYTSWPPISFWAETFCWTARNFSRSYLTSISRSSRSLLFVSSCISLAWDLFFNSSLSYCFSFRSFSMVFSCLKSSVLVWSSWEVLSSNVFISLFSLFFFSNSFYRKSSSFFLFASFSEISRSFYWSKYSN